MQREVKYWITVMMEVPALLFLPFYEHAAAHLNLPQPPSLSLYCMYHDIILSNFPHIIQPQVIIRIIILSSLFLNPHKLNEVLHPNGTARPLKHTIPLLLDYSVHKHTIKYIHVHATTILIT